LSTISTDRLYSIKEASQLTGLPASTLRYYETIGIIEPVARGDTSGHRQYTQEMLNTIDAVACLNATGMPLDEMREYLNNRSRGSNAADAVIQLLEAHERRLKTEQMFLKLRKQYVGLKIAYWKAVKAGDQAQVKQIGEMAQKLAHDLKFRQDL